MKSKKIFIIGGSGSLGNKLITRYLENNKVINYSRDESKHWRMELLYNKHKNLQNIIGDIHDKDKLKQSLKRVKPDIIIIAAALKHIDRCEFESGESINTNILGVKNVLDVIEDINNDLINLETVCFVSTDKACSPVNIYGMCKSISERLMVEKSKYIKNIKFVCVRYGNVLNSRGSIIPILQNKCANENIKTLTLTSEKMTRYIMTLEESVELIEYAILKGNTGETCIPKLRSMSIKDLIELFAEKFNKDIKITGIRCGEKFHESLINELESMRVIDKGKYYHIIPSYLNIYDETKTFHYHSGTETLSKEELKEYMEKLRFI